MTDQPCGPIDWARRQQAEREARQTTSPAETEATEPAPWSQVEAHAFNAVQPTLQESGEWLRLSSRRAAVQPHLVGHYQHAVDAAVAAEQRAEKAEAALDRVRDARERIAHAPGWVDAIWCLDVLEEALNGPPAHNAGPTVREAADQDAAHWNDKYAGEGP